MAKHVNNTNFDDLFNAPSTPTVIEVDQRAEAKAIGKEINKKTHVSVLLNREDFDYIRDLCFERRISKNKFFKAALEAYKRGDWGL
ncbi:MAG: hypothetical protein IJH92_08735 [Mogibacterium sp.]|nr:hypothetical protein [Mogibacterium sp.]